MRNFYEEWHNNPHCTTYHWVLFISISLFLSFTIINAINLTYSETEHIFAQTIPSLVQDTSSGAASALSIQSTFSNVSAGNLMVVATLSNTSSFTTVTDNQNNTYTEHVSATAGDGRTYRVWSAPITSSGSLAITLSASGSAQRLGMTATEFSGVDTSSSRVDAYNSASGTGTSVSSGNVTTTVSGALLFGAIGTTGANPGASLGAGYSNLESNITGRITNESKVVSGTVTDDADFTLATSQGWGAMIVVYKPSGLPPPTGDTTSPAVSISSPTAGAIVSGTSAVITVSASDNVGLAGVAFRLDGAVLGEDTIAPYSFAWDTTLASNGTHTLTAVARDTSNNTTTSGGVTVTISNPVTSPPTPPSPSGLLFQTSFTTAEGWNSDATQLGSSIGTGTFSGFQAGVTNYGSWSTSNGNRDLVNIAGNNPNGAGGRGLRHPRGDGQNSNGGGIKITHAPVSEVFYRYYAKYQQGFSWSPPGQPNYTKDVYINVGGGAPVATLGFHGTNTWGVAVVSPGSSNPGGNYGWVNMMGGNPSDGQWHCYEARLKMDTNGSNGVREGWIDGIQTHSQSNINWGTAGAFNWAVFGENQAFPANGGIDMYIDFDDIAIGTSRIGCLGSTPPPPPPPTDTTPPTVSISAPSAGATISGSSVTLSASASDNVGVVGIQFKVDGNNVGTEDTSSPYSITINPTTLTNGSHTITATARDAAGNQTTSSGISVTVSNTTSTTIISTTYNCPEWNQSMGLGETQVCLAGDGIRGEGGWTTSNGSMEQITTAANYPAGGGGRGQRHWIGNGLNNTSGSLGFDFSQRNELYIRWYVRWQSGLSLGSAGGAGPSHKALYFNGSGCGHTGGCYFLLEPTRLRLTVAGNNFQNSSTNFGWDQIHGNNTASDGNWHCSEVRVKSESSAGAGNGIAQWWIDGTLRLNETSVNFNNSATGFNHFEFPSNGVFATVGGADMYSDLDDVVVSTSPIGCLGSAPTPTPSPTPSANPSPVTILFSEAFENNSYSTRGWYDSSGGALSTIERIEGVSSFECRFALGGTGCSGGTPSRHAITDTDSAYISYSIKHSPNWVGSGVSYHPHMFHLITNADPAYVGPAFTYLTTYMEENAGRIGVGTQDGKNIDQTKINQNLVGTTESRAVSGCNGNSDSFGLPYQCYNSGNGTYWNGKTHFTTQQYFSNSTGLNYKGDWHNVAAYYKLNSIVNGIGVADGIIQYWYDGQLIIDQRNVMFKTGAHPNMKFNQFVMTPYIGVGSPADQSFWIDNLVVSSSYNGAPSSTPTPPPPPLPPASTKFTSGQRVQTNANLNVRSLPSISSTVLGTQSPGSPGTVVSGGTQSDGYFWWNINFDSGVDGYVAEDFLVDYVSPTPPPPSDTTAPVISSISSGSPTQTGTIITWTTSESSTASVEYGPTTSYGLTSNSSGSVSHSVSLSSLSPSTTYNYRVRATDAAGNLTVSNNATFTTQATTDIQAPNAVSDFRTTDIQARSANLAWTAPSDPPFNSSVKNFDIRYSTLPITTSNWNTIFTVTGEPTPGTPGGSNTYTIIGLSPNTLYYASIRSSDSSGNLSSLSNALNFSTLPEVSGVSSGTGGGTGGGGGGTGGGEGSISYLDPVSQFQASVADSQVSLSWVNPSSPDFARTILVRKEGSAPSSVMDGTQVYEGTDRQFVDVSLKNNRTYYYRAFAVSRSSQYFASGYLSATPVAGVTQTVTKTAITTKASSLGTLTGPFALGYNSNQVRLLQEMLIKEGVYPEAITTGYYGPLTQTAVKRFQAKHGIEQTGLAGPQTRAKLNEIYGSSPQAAVVPAPAGSISEPERQALIQQIQTQLAVLIQQLIQLLAEQQAEL